MTDLGVAEQTAAVLGHFGVTGGRSATRCFFCQPSVTVVKVTPGMGLDELVLACLTHWREQHRTEQP